MIDPKTLTENDIGREVKYQDCYNKDYGTLSSWNDKYIFVKFRGPNGEACKPAYVEFTNKENK